MKRIPMYFLPGILLILTACEKVIEVDIDAAAPQVVIEAEVAEGPGPHYVYLTRSVGIDAASTFPEIQGAFVEIRDDEGHADTLHEISPGLYASSSLAGRSGHTYSLTVTVKGETFAAHSAMPLPVQMDSAYHMQASVLGGNRYPVVVTLQDPPQERNQYRFLSYINGFRRGGSIPENDAFFDGQAAQIFLPGLGADLAVGDTLLLEMQCIDAAVFHYFDSFDAVGDGPGSSSAPANPSTNITGGALGYFNACTKSIKTLIIH